MAILTLTDAFAYVHGVDMQTHSNQIQMSVDVAQIVVGAFGDDGWQRTIAGQKSQTFDMAGYWDAGTGGMDDQAWADIGVANRVYTIGPKDTETETAYLFRAGQLHYELPTGSFGDAAGFSVHSAGSGAAGGVVRGQLAKATGNVSATGALGSGLTLGAVGSDQYLYATFHVFSAGTTITVVVESDDNSGFTSATTQTTIGPITTTGGTWATRVAGPITDTHYRMRVTAITGTFSVAGAIGIGS